MENQVRLESGGYADYQGEVVRVVATDWEGGVLIKPLHRSDGPASWGKKVVDASELTPVDLADPDTAGVEADPELVAPFTVTVDAEALSSLVLGDSDGGSADSEPGPDPDGEQS